MTTKISGYSSRKQSSSQKCYEKSGSSKKSRGQHKSAGKKKSGGHHKSSGKKSSSCCQHKSSCKEHKSSGGCCQHKSSGSCYQHKSSGCHDHSAIPSNQGEKAGGKNNAEYAYGILSKLSLGQVIHRVTLDNGKDLDKVKWAGFQNGNATFSAVSYKTTYIVYVPLNKITSIAL